MYICEVGSERVLSAVGYWSR